MHGNYKNFQGPISLYIKTEKNKLFFLLRVSHFFAEVLQTITKYYWYLNIFSSSLWKKNVMWLFLHKTWTVHIPD
jgi:hypothetical protein